MKLFEFFKKPPKLGTLGIEVGPDGMAVAFIATNKHSAVSDGNDVSGSHLQCKYIQGRNFSDNAKVLKRFLAKRGLQGVPANVVLHPAFYEIYFVDRPDVDDEDLDEAVKWKVKDLVDGSLKDLVIDAFALPNDAYRGTQKKVYAVSTKRDCLESIVSAMKEAEVNLKTIDIGELAIGNIVSILHKEPGGAALLRMLRNSGTIDLSEGGQLYFTRQLDSGVRKLEVEDEERKQVVMDDMLLEIQRSLDFYDSQLGKGAVRKFLIAPTELADKDVDNHLKDFLGLKVESIDLNKMFDVEVEMSGGLQGQCFAAVGAALSHQLN